MTYTYKEEQEKKRQAQREHVKEVTGLLNTALSVIFAGNLDIRGDWTKNSQSLHDERILVKEFANNDFSAYNEEFAEFRYNTLLKNFKAILAHAKNYLDTVLKNRAAVAKAREAQKIDNDDEPAVINTISGGGESKPAPRIVRNVSARSIFWRIPCLNNKYTLTSYEEARRRFLSTNAYFCGVYHETNGAAIDDEIRQLSQKKPLKAGPLRALYEITRVIFYNYGAKRADGCCFGFPPFLPETQEEIQARKKVMDVYKICYEHAKHVTESEEEIA